MVDRSQISEIFVEILAFGDVYARLGKRAVSERTWSFDIDLAGDELLLELSIAFCAALRLVSIISVPGTTMMVIGRNTYAWLVSKVATVQAGPLVGKGDAQNVHRSAWQLRSRLLLCDTPARLLDLSGPDAASGMALGRCSPFSCVQSRLAYLRRRAVELAWVFTLEIVHLELYIFCHCDCC